MKEEKIKKIENEIEEINSELETLPGGTKAFIIGLAVALIVAVLSFTWVYAGFFGVVAVTVLTYLASQGKIKSPEAETVISTSFIFIPIFILVMLLVQALVWIGTAIVLLFL